MNTKSVGPLIYYKLCAILQMILDHLKPPTLIFNLNESFLAPAGNMPKYMVLSTSVPLHNLT